MSDSFGVEVEDTIQDLLEELSGFLLAQRLFLCQKIEELTAGHTGRRERRQEDRIKKVADQSQLQIPV